MPATECVKVDKVQGIASEDIFPSHNQILDPYLLGEALRNAAVICDKHHPMISASQ